jgi:hypothetical protein
VKFISGTTYYKLNIESSTLAALQFGGQGLQPMRLYVSFWTGLSLIMNFEF